MKKHGWVCLAILLTVFAGCGKKEEESIPLVSDTVSEEKTFTQAEQDLESDLKAISFTIQGKLCKLPLKYEDAVAMGWEYQGDETKEMDAESYIEEQSFRIGDMQIKTDITNFSLDKLPITQCYIGSVYIEQTDEINSNKEAIRVVLPGSIIMQQSTVVQAEEAYGAPQDRYQDEAKIMLTYEYGLNKSVVLTFEGSTEVLAAADLCNRQNPENEKIFKEITTKTTEEVKNYKKPEIMSDDFFDYVVSYSGILYRLPAPVAEFLDHEWVIQEDKSDSAVKAGKYGYVTLSKDNQNLYAVVFNSGEEDTWINNCFVTSLYGDLSGMKVPIGVSKGITLGMNTQNLTAVLEGTEYEEVEDQEAGTVTFFFYENDKRLDYTAITVDTALQMVSALKVVRYPEGQYVEENEITKVLENLALVQKGF